MIFELLFFLVFSVITALLSFIPGANSYPLLLPYGIDGILVNGFNYLKTVQLAIPPLVTLVTAFLILLGWKIAVIFIRLFIGDRSPVQN